MPKGGRSMTTEEKNKIIELNNAGKKKRAIARLINRDPMTVLRFLDSLDPKIKFFSICPACGEEFAQYKGPGRRRIYCSNKCRHSIKIDKVDERICLNCGKHFITWKNKKKIRFCSQACYFEYRRGQRLQNKSSELYDQ